MKGRTHRRNLPLARWLQHSTVVVALLAVSCLDLDPFLYGGIELSRYELDSYSGDRECDDYIDLAGPIEDSLVHLVHFPSGGEDIYGIFLHTDTTCQATDTLVLYFHGKSDHIDNYWPRTRILYDMSDGRYPVLIIDYRGYGMSTGETTEDGVYEDAASALAYVQSTLGDPSVFVYAYSIGTVAGGKAAVDNPTGRIIGLAMEAPVGSVSGIVSDATILNIPGSAVTTYTANNIERIASVTVPFLWLHGTEDGTLSIEDHGRPVWDNYQGGDGAARVENGGLHYNLPKAISSDYATYKDLVRYFIQGTHRSHATLYTEFKP